MEVCRYSKPHCEQATGYLYGSVPLRPSARPVDTQERENFHYFNHEADFIVLQGYIYLFYAQETFGQLRIMYMSKIIIGLS